MVPKLLFLIPILAALLYVFSHFLCQPLLPMGMLLVVSNRKPISKWFKLCKNFIGSYNQNDWRQSNPGIAYEGSGLFLYDSHSSVFLKILASFSTGWKNWQGADFGCSKCYYAEEETLSPVVSQKRKLLSQKPLKIPYLASKKGIRSHAIPVLIASDGLVQIMNA